MKKLLVGCLFFFLILTVVGAVGGYFFVYRPAMSFIDDVQEFTEWEERLDEAGPYEPPQDGIVTAEQVERFVAVQEVVDELLGTQIEEIAEAARQVEGGGNPDLTELWQLFRQVRGLFGEANDARDAQVEAMNEQGFSAEEYDWIQSRVMDTIWPGQSIENIDDLIGDNGTITLPTQQDAEAAAEGQSLDMTTWNANREAFSAYLDDMPRWARYWPLEF